MGLTMFLIIYLSLPMNLRTFLIFDNFVPGDSYKKNSYIKKQCMSPRIIPAASLVSKSLYASYCFINFKLILTLS